MAIFITVLAFQDAGAAAGSKLAILLGSLLSGVAGLGILMYAGRQAEAGIPEPVD
jgi:Na+/H+ antiporter NhaA